jgi:proteasome lid subunit RPN8/RPN11
VPPQLYAAVIGQAQAEAPLECCGLLAGRVRDGVGAVEVRYPLVNEAASPVEFVSEGRGMFDATRDIDRRGLQMLAVYHSHPASPPVPSKTDLARSYSPDVVNVIVSLRSDPPVVRAWWLWDGQYAEAEILIEASAEGK